MTGDTYRVFLSYALDEKPYVTAVARELERRGVHAWIDEEQVAPGGAWEEAVELALRTTPVTVVFLTGRALSSPWLNFVIGAGVGGDKRVIPVFLSATARREAPSILLDRPGIEAFDLKPDEVAAQIADAIDATPSAA